MSKRQILMIIGALIIVIPFLGFPSAWYKLFAVLLGICVVGISYSVKPANKQQNVPFVEYKSPSAQPASGAKASANGSSSASEISEKPEINQ